MENVIQSLDSSKAHGPDMISIRMLKICGKSIIKPHLIIYKNALRRVVFPTNGKKTNVVPVHKKNGKQLLKNYQLISLFPICGKALEKIIYNTMFECFIQNNLITPNQSGF